MQACRFGASRRTLLCWGPLQPAVSGFGRQHDMGAPAWGKAHSAQAHLLPIHWSTPCRLAPCRDGGTIAHVRFQNISASTRLYHPSWWGAAEPIYVTALPRNRSTQVGEWGFGHKKKPVLWTELWRGQRQRPAGRPGVVCTQKCWGRLCLAVSLSPCLARSHCSWSAVSASSHALFHYCRLAW